MSGKEHEYVALGCVGVLLVGPLATIWHGYVLSILWGWFVAPALSAPRLSVPAAIGVALTVSVLRSGHDRGDDKSEQKCSNVIAGWIGRYFVGPLFALGIGWIVARWM